MYDITRPVSSVNPLSPAECLAHRNLDCTVQFVPDGFRAATAHTIDLTRSVRFVRRLSALLLALSATFAAGLVIGVADAGASPNPNPNPRPSVPTVSVPTAKDFTIDQGALQRPSVVLPQPPAADGPVNPGSSEPLVPQPVDPTDPGRFRVDPEALEPVRPNFDGVAQALPAADEALPTADEALPAADEALPAAGEATPVDPGVSAETDSDVPAGSLAMTGSSAVAALVGAGVLVAGAAMVLTARSARRRARVAA